jgi:hypothetical protein
MLFNQGMGTFPGDVPFDFDRHRASPFTFDVPDGQNIKKKLATLREPLVDLLTSAIRSIIEKNPQKPFLERERTEEEKKKARDTTNLKWLMSKINIPTLETHIEEIPHKIHERIFFFWEDYKQVAQSSLFYLYDKEAARLVSEVRETWGGTLSFGCQYRDHPQRDVFFFSTPLDIFNEEQQKDWDTIENLRKGLNEAFRKLLNHINENYLEIDLTELSNDAWDAYIEFNKKWVERLEEGPDRKEQD